MTIEPTQSEPVSNLEISKYPVLAGAIWIFGGIHISGTDFVPVILITMPSPLIYKYKEDFSELGATTYRGANGYFTLQIKKRESVKKVLLNIQPFMRGEEELQIKIALEMIEVLKIKRSLRSREAKEEQIKKLKELYSEWDTSRNRLRNWTEAFVEEHKGEKVIKNIPKAIWSKAYLLPEFMETVGYPLVPKMVKKLS